MAGDRRLMEMIFTCLQVGSNVYVLQIKNMARKNGVFPSLSQDLSRILNPFRFDIKGLGCGALCFEQNSGGPRSGTKRPRPVMMLPT